MTWVPYHPFTFEAPPGWEDRTVAAFFGQPQPGDVIAPNVVVTREPRRDGDRLRTHVQRQLLILAGALEGFDVLESEEIVVAGRVALQTRCMWSAQNATIEQTMVHLEPAEEDTTVMTVTCTSSLEAASAVWPVFERVVASLQLVQPPAQSTAVPSSYAPLPAAWAKR
jgi:hypothetical protein